MLSRTPPGEEGEARAFLNKPRGRLKQALDMEKARDTFRDAPIPHEWVTELNLSKFDRETRHKLETALRDSNGGGPNEAIFALGEFSFHAHRSILRMRCTTSKVAYRIDPSSYV